MIQCADLWMRDKAKTDPTDHWSAKRNFDPACFSMTGVVKQQAEMNRNTGEV